MLPQKVTNAISKIPVPRFVGGGEGVGTFCNFLFTSLVPGSIGLGSSLNGMNLGANSSFKSLPQLKREAKKKLP